MRAVVTVAHGNRDQLVYRTDYPDPVPEANDVVVAVAATAINYHDIFTRRGMPGIRIPMPCIMGLDFSGEIVEVGAGVEGDWRVGQRVMIDPVDRVNFGGLLGEMRPGGLAEYCAVPAHHLVALPDAVSYEAAACLPVAYGTALRMMVTIGQVKQGERVLILGASGGVGTCCVQLAKLAGAEVIACASSAAKLNRLAELGADHLLDYTQQDFVKWVYEQWGKPHRRKFEGGVDVVVNFTGGDTWVPSLKALHRQGRLLTCGATAGFDPKEDLRYVWTFELRVLGSNGWMREDLLALLDMVRDGRMKPVIGCALPLEQVNDAFRLLEEREVFGKVLLRP